MKAKIRTFKIRGLDIETEGLDRDVNMFLADPKVRVVSLAYQAIGEGLLMIYHYDELDPGDKTFSSDEEGGAILNEDPRTKPYANPGDKFEHKGVSYTVENTGLARGALKINEEVTPIIMYRRDEPHPLIFARERKEFLKKFKPIYRNTKYKDS